MKREDRIAILDWADSTGADSPTKEKIKGILDDIDALDVLQSVDVDKALERTRKKIRRQGNGRLLWFSLAGAAISAAACTAVFLFLGIFGVTGTDPVYSELKVNPGMTGTFILPDSSVVVLNGGSVLSYNGSFNDKTREVTLDGEAYFDVAKDEKIPFIVHTPSSSSVKVYGTQFNVDAYGDDDCRVTLINGSIGFRYTGKYGQNNEVMVEPGQRLVYDRESDSVQMSDVSVKTDIAWKDGKIILDATPLPEILDILSKRYSVEFDVRDQRFLDYKYSGGTFTMFSLEKVLETLQYSSSFKWKYDDTAAPDQPPSTTIY